MAMEQKLRDGDFDLEDFLQQLQQIKKLGSLTDLLSMIPGVNRAMKDVDPQLAEGSLKKTEAIISSMTRKERQLPDILNASRRRRIALGSGTSVQDVNMLLKQFRDMQKMMKQMGIMGGGKKNRRGRGGLGNLMNLFGGPGQ
jgi:signal recognition particle subunit SRP54